MREYRFKDWKPPEIQHGKLTKWNWTVHHPNNLELGQKTDIGSFTYINAKFGVEIQDFVQIGSHCSIYSESTIDAKQGKITIRRNSRVGSHSLIMPGITIGENSIIGAFSFVNKDIPSGVLAFGIPIKIRKKFSPEEVELLIQKVDE